MNYILFNLLIVLGVAYGADRQESSTLNMDRDPISIGVYNHDNSLNIVPDSVLLKEDSLIFYTSLHKEDSIINLYCECTGVNGATSPLCRGFIKSLSAQQKITDGIRNKYYYTDGVSPLLSREVKIRTNKFNECSK
jgi:hypothetical protein